MRTFFTSDLHFGHRLVAGKRGFWHTREDTGLTEPDVDAHNEALIANWNKVVGPEDETWVLGDLTVGWGLDDIRPLIWRLNGTKRLVFGNHDEGHPAHRGSHKKHDTYSGGFESVHVFEMLRMEGQQVMLSHFPYDGDRTPEDRGAQWRLRDEGDPLIHGHTHLPPKITRSAKGTLQIHVGLDAHDMKPVPEAWVMRMLRENRAEAAA